MHRLTLFAMNCLIDQSEENIAKIDYVIRQKDETEFNYLFSRMTKNLQLVLDLRDLENLKKIRDVKCPDNPNELLMPYWKVSPSATCVDKVTMVDPSRTLEESFRWEVVDLAS